MPAPLKQKDFDALQQTFTTVREELKKIIFGQDDVIDLVLTSLLSGGHVLLVGPPGLAKTLLVTSLAEVSGLKSARIQSTPDLMPSDIIGSEILEEDTKGKRSFRFVKGPIFTNILIADEINRASPRTQSALLQAMQEYHVSVGGKDHAIKAPFHVIATQNPIEQDGTYPLPEAQLDRFFMQIDVDYPSIDAERDMLKATTFGEEILIKPVISAKEILKAQALIRQMPIGESVIEDILKLMQQCRPGESRNKAVQRYVEWAPGPRASQALSIGTRAYAFLRGDMAPSSDDIAALAAPILKHRMAFNFAAKAENIDTESLIQDLCSAL